MNEKAVKTIPEEAIYLSENEKKQKSYSIVVPPDGGFGWIVMSASFFCNVIVDGIVFSSGLIQNAISEEFKISKAEVGLVSSLLSGFYLLAGPFVSALVNKYGFRVTTIFGAILACLSFCFASMAPNIMTLFAFYGVFGGIGFCFIYIPSVLVVGYYFEKWRALATGLSLCGSGIGTFIFAPVTSSMVEQYGWRNTVFIQAGIILLCCLFGGFFKPLKPIEVTKDFETAQTPETEIMLTNLKKPAFSKRHAHSVPASAHSTWLKTQQFVYPKISDVFSNSKRMRESITMNDQIQEGYECSSNSNNAIHAFDSNKRRATITEKNIKIRERNEGPFSRYDIFFTGSLNRIPQYVSQTSLGYHISVTQTTDTNKVKEKDSITTTLKKLLQFSLLKTPAFVFLACSGFFTMSGFFVPFIYITSRAQSSDSADMKDLAVYLVPAIGISNTIARVLCGYASSSNKVNALLLNNIFITIGGVATLLSGIYLTPIWQFTYTVLFGFSIACFSTLRSIIVVELMGLENLTNAFGLLMMFQGIAAAIGGPLAGYFMDLTNSYDASFYAAGSLITFSAILCYPLNYLKKKSAKK